MEKLNVKIGELNFELIIQDDEEILPTLEIENEAVELRKLLDQFITQSTNS
jgi:hypothetical protein